MATKKATSALQLAGQNVPEVLSRLDAELAKMKRIEESVYKTSGKVDGVRIDGFDSIKTEKNVATLIKVLSSIQGREDGYHKAAATLGLSKYPVFNVGGSPIADWIADIQLRIDIINQQDTLDKLNYFKKEVSKFLSEEDQKNALLSEMEKFFNK